MQHKKRRGLKCCGQKERQADAGVGVGAAKRQLLPLPQLVVNLLTLLQIEAAAAAVADFKETPSLPFFNISLSFPSLSLRC